MCVENEFGNLLFAECFYDGRFSKEELDGLWKYLRGE
jgi:hypothetical protein